MKAIAPPGLVAPAENPPCPPHVGGEKNDRHWVSHLIYLFVLLWSLTSCASVWEAQRIRREVREVKDRVDAIEEGKIKELRGETERQIEDLRAKQADLLVRIEEAKTKIMQLQGEIEELSHSNEQTVKELEAVKDILNSIQEDLKMAAEVPKDEESIYKQGLGFYNSKEYDKAKSTLKIIKENFPNGKYIDNAHYWTGECYFSEGNYLAAIDEFGVVIEKYPNSPKRPSALLKAGMAFLELKRKNEAKAFFNRLLKDHPKSEQANIAKKKLARMN